MTSSPEYYRLSILWLFLSPALGGFLFGYDIGGTSYAILQLAALDPASTLSLDQAPLKTGCFVSAPSAGALLGTAFLVYIDQHWQTNQSKSKSKSKNNWFLPMEMGRRTELIYAGIMYAIGGCLQYLSSLDLVPSIAKFAVVVVGRWIYGAGIGFAMHGGPTYLAETTPPSVRGMVVGAKEIAIVLGILCGYVVGNSFCTIPDNTSNQAGWASVYGLTTFGAIFMVALSKTIPESPRYLVCENHHHTLQQLYSLKPNHEELDTDKVRDEIQQQISSQVLESLKFVWHHHRAMEEHDKLMQIYSKHQTHAMRTNSMDTQPQPHSQSLSSLLSDPSVKPALKAGLGLVILQQITGQPSVLSYATPILARVPGLGSNASVLLALFKVLATSVSVVLVEIHGRKTLLRAGCSLMLLALIVLAVAFREPSGDTSSNSNSDHTRLDTTSILALLGMFAYIAGYQIGFGPITWLMISEVFPQSVRSTTVALAVQANFALNALVQLLVPLLQTSLGMSVTFGIFGGLTGYSLWFVQHGVPETKGLTLEEIEEKLAGMATLDSRTSQIRQDSMFLDPDDDFEPAARRRSSRDVEHDDERIRLLPS